MSKTDTDIMDKIYFNKYGCAMKIIEYNSSKDVIVEFQDEFCSKVHTNMRNIRAGSVKNPYYPSVFGVGIIGNIYPTSSDENVPLKEYTTWKAMLNRCYYEKNIIIEHAMINVRCAMNGFIMIIFMNGFINNQTLKN